MEVSIGDYGKMVFEMMLGSFGDMPDHWKSISDEAKPLVTKLLELNKKMSGGGYEIHGYVEEVLGKKKIKLSKWKRIQAAWRKSWEVETNTLKKGDLVWLHKDCDISMENIHSEPVAVNLVAGDRVMVDHPFVRHGIYEIHDDKVLKAPSDWKEMESEYTSDKYWLEQADKFDI